MYAAGPEILPGLIQAIAKTIDENAEALTGLDQAIGDGDHVSNLERGIKALIGHNAEYAGMSWQAAFQKIGMTVMSAVGGASGSLYATLFLALAKNCQEKELTLSVFADAFQKAVEAVKLRGKADKGEKTMLDVLIPVADQLIADAGKSLPLSEILENVKKVAVSGAESTRDMIATKGRASFLGERSKGHVDAGAKSSQLMICAIADCLMSG
jgi:dihydroxyacetone kinase-like protein